VAEGMRDGYKIGDVQALAMSAQPMLEVTEQTHDGLSLIDGAREPQDTTGHATSQVSREWRIN
jgi:hypothetical protein